VRRHAAEILRLVDFVLSRAGARPGDLDGIVLGDGTGGFTGLRIGWATAKGLAQESGLEVRAVPSLLAAAAGAATRLGAVPIAACFDALRGQVYAAVYVVHPDRVETLVAPCPRRPSRWISCRRRPRCCSRWPNARGRRE
jgi:tRNA threonylcarbamoyl adenosine modification protein YeaZ